MKLGKIFSVLAAAVLLFAGCNEKEDLGSQKLELSASSVSFDAATEGSQTITITATRDWTAVPSENWITVGPASGKGSASAQTVTISVSANSEVDRTGTVKFTAGSIVRTLNVSQKGEAGESLEVVYDAELGAPLEVEGQVVAINNTGVVITDGKTNVVVYNKASNHKAPEGIAIGDKVSVKGVRGQYEGQTNFPQITMESEGYTDLVKLSSGTAVYPEPVVITAANIDEEIMKTKSSYVEMSGILSISGFYGNVAIEGTSKEGSLEGMIEGAFDEYVGVPATFRGYFAGTPKGATYYKLIVSSVEVSSEPYLAVPESLSANAEETSVKFELKSNGAWTIVSDNSAYTVSPASGNGDADITVSFAANNTEDNVNVVLTAKAGELEKNISLLHKGKLPSGEKPLTSNIEVTGNSGKYYDKQNIVINDETYSGYKLGTSSAGGSFTVNVAGKTKIGFYAMGWKGESTTLYLKNGDNVVAEFKLKSHDAISGNPPFKVGEVSDEYYYTQTLDGIESLTFATEAKSGPRAVFFGINAE